MQPKITPWSAAAAAAATAVAAEPCWLSNSSMACCTDKVNKAVVQQPNAQSAWATAAYLVPDEVAPEPVTGPQNLHLLQRHSLGLRQEEDDVQGHHSSPEGKEEVSSPLHPAHDTAAISNTSCTPWTHASLNCMLRVSRQDLGCRHTGSY